MQSDVITNGATTSGVSYISWSAIFAGALLATTYSFIMLTFGGAAGLSLAAPFDLDGTSQTLLLIAAGLWLIWVQVSGFALGGYVAGRIRPRVLDANEHEVEVRDGVHGLLVWAVGVLLGIIIAVHAAGSVLGAAGQAATAFTPGQQNASSVAGITADAAVDSLFRSDSATRQPANEQLRAEVGRIIAPAVAGQEVSSEDRTYLAQLVANQTGLATEQAAERVDQVVATTREAAEDARKALIIIGFISVASLLVSAVAAWWAADIGGDHRDRNLDFSRFGRWRTGVTTAAGSVVAGNEDLTKIKGIGPALRRQLYERDIKTFEKIANFSQRDIDHLNNELGFPGRIEREKWVEQAKEFAKQRV